MAEALETQGQFPVKTGAQEFKANGLNHILDSGFRRCD